MNVHKLSITKKQFDAIPDDECVFFLQASVMINEMAMLLKIIYFNKAEDINEIEKKGLYLISDVRLGFCMYLNQIYFQKGSFFS
jgi:hypothetical protein